MKDTPRNNRLSWLLVVGSGLVVLVLSVLRLADATGSPSTSITGSIVQLLIGAFVTALGLWQLRAPKQERPEADQQ
ncbi:hypothetical protein OF385_15130 [Glutamicibacter sp. JL.03c]|uniref:hypothetical protein n=1 Tax=Glutamicibacter sp. JL.03c TaxID=2984842 RepID=UPI0021F78673|nr:hypothetical protein [Glutamicibacter sp. JL.03c]UYQ77332.1 hypothetical protein OF385_15130 [Glutamicibacter sp. JL.03c]